MYPTETEITNCHTGDKTSRTPPVRGAIFQRQVVSPQLRKKMTEEKTMSGDRARGRGPVARCLYEQLLTNGWYNTFSIVNTFYINEMSLVNKFLVSGTVLKWQKTRLNFVPIESEFVLDPPSFPFYRHLLKTAAALDILPRHAVIC